jgi:hypothetical protein
MTRVLRVAGNGFRGFFGTVTNGFRAIGRAIFSVQGLLAGAFAFFSGRAFVNQTRTISTLVGEYEIWAEKLGITTERLDALSFAAEQNGGSFDQMREGLKNLQERLDDAARGSVEFQRQFARLGIEVLDPQTGRIRNSADVLEQMAQAFAQLREQGRSEDLVKISEDLLGGSEQLLSVMLARGPDAIRVWTDMAKEMGLVTAQQARLGRVVAQSFNEIDRSWRAFQVAVLEEFGDEIVATIRTAAKFLRENSGFIIRVATDVITGIFQIVAAVGQAIITVVRAILRAIDVVSQAIDDVIAGIRDAVGFVSDLFGAAGPPAAAAPTVRRTGQDASQEIDKASTAIDTLESRFNRLRGSFFATIDRMATAWVGFREQAQQEIGRVVVTAEHDLPKALEGAFDRFFAGFSEGFAAWRDQLKEMSLFGANAAREIFGTVESASATFIETLIKGTARFKDAWKAALVSILDATIQTFSQLLARNLLGGLFNGLFTGGLGGGGGSTPIVPGGDGVRVLSGVGGGGPNSLGRPGGDQITINLAVSAIDERGVARFFQENEALVGATVAGQIQRNAGLRELIRRR